MALYKEMVNEKGVIMKYFRISDVAISIDNSNVVITVKEYFDNTYRSKEKKIDTLQSDINEKQKYINTLNENYRENEEEIMTKNNELNLIIEELNTVRGQVYYIDEQTYTFDFENTDYSLTKCYEMLKTLEIFADSKDA